MRHSRSQFTVRRMMIVVAVTAFGLMGWRGLGRWTIAQHYRDQAASYSRGAQATLTRLTKEETAVAEMEREIAGLEMQVAESVGAERSDSATRVSSLRAFVSQDAPYIADSRKGYAQILEKKRHCEFLGRKYRLAARRPWLSVESDPPAPK